MATEGLSLSALPRCRAEKAENLNRSQSLQCLRTGSDWDSHFKIAAMMNSGNQRSLTRILILVALSAAILLAGLFLFVTVTWAADVPDGSQPQLHIPDNIPSGPASVVRVPVVLTATNQHVSGVARGDGGIDWSFGRKRGLGL